MAQSRKFTPLELPLSSVAYGRAVLRADQVSFYHVDQPPFELPAHIHAHGQVSFLIGPASCLVHWADRRGQWHEQVLSGPHIYVVAPGQVHASQWDQVAGLLEIYYEPEVFSRLFPRKSQGVYFADAASVAGRDFVILQLTSVLRHLCDQPRPDLELLESIALGLLSRLGKLLKSKPVKPVSANGPVLFCDEERRIREFVFANLHREIQVADLAKLMGLSLVHFTIAFKNTTGKNPSDFVLECRLSKAHDLLFVGEHALGIVAKMVGLRGQWDFSHRFHAFFGYGPLRLQQRSSQRNKTFEAHRDRITAR